MITTREILENSKIAKKNAFLITTEQKNKALAEMARSLRNRKAEILSANETDISAALENGISEIMTDRLRLTEKRVEDMAKAIENIEKLPDPCGRVLSESVNSSGLLIKQVSVPIGTIAVIYESRPNVTGEAAALILKSGNVCILRGGKEAFNSSYAVVSAMKEGLSNAGLDTNLISMVEDRSRNSADELMRAVGFVDLLIPRGGAGLINACVQNAKVPCIETGVGICHIFVDESADLDKAAQIIENAKMSRPSVCNSEEVCLVHKNVSRKFLPMLYKKLCEDRIKKGLPPCELRLDKRAMEIIPGKAASESDFDTEFLDYILSVAVVDDVRAAAEHIEKHSTHHSEAILTENSENAEFFTRAVDSAAVYVNASTRFTDGGEFGFGGEIGISTQKLHARGPMGLAALNTYKYIISGNGQIRG